MKTNQEWFEEAKEQGYTWADDYFIQITRYNSSKLFELNDSMSRAIMYSFIWDDTPQGRIYWEDIARDPTRPTDERLNKAKEAKEAKEAECVDGNSLIMSATTPPPMRYFYVVTIQWMMRSITHAMVSLRKSTRP